MNYILIFMLNVYFFLHRTPTLILHNYEVKLNSFCLVYLCLWSLTFNFFFSCSRLDLREGGDKEEYVDSSVEGRVRSDRSGAHLTFDPVQGQDSGRYRCRVDFEVSPTLFALVNLTVYGEWKVIIKLRQDQ